MSFFYLASPYWHEDEEIRVHRFNCAREWTIQLMKEGVITYSPILHNHPLAATIKHKTRGDAHKFWLTADLALLRCARQLLILPLDGWETSAGIIEEVNVAKFLRMPVTILQTKERDLSISDLTQSDATRFGANGISYLSHGGLS